MPQPWRDVVLAERITISGGHSKSHFPVEAFVLDDVVDNVVQTFTFVKVNKGYEWLFKTVAGDSASRKHLANLKILEEIETQIKTQNASSDDSQEQGVPVAKRARKSKRGMNHVHVVRVPEMPSQSTAVAELAEGDTREIRVYCNGSHGLWLDREAIPWLCNYLRAERDEGCDADASRTVDSPIDGVDIAWDFAENEYIVKIDKTKYPHLPATVRSSPKDLDQGKYQAMGFEGPVASATADDRQDATRKWVLHWCITECKKAAK